MTSAAYQIAGLINNAWFTNQEQLFGFLKRYLLLELITAQAAIERRTLDSEETLIIADTDTHRAPVAATDITLLDTITLVCAALKIRAAHQEFPFYLHSSEASFLSCIGCAASDDPIVSYYAYFEMYYELDKAYRTSVPDEALRGEMTALDDQVWIDIKESQEEAAKLYASEYHPLEQLKPEAKKAATTGWSTQGKILGAYNYGGVVNLLMRFYGYEGK